MTGEPSCILFHNTCQGFYMNWINRVGFFGEPVEQSFIKKPPPWQMKTLISKTLNGFLTFGASCVKFNIIRRIEPFQ